MRDALDGAGVLLAAGFRGPAQFRGDRGPAGAVAAQLGQPPLLLGQPRVELAEQFAAGDDPAGGLVLAPARPSASRGSLRRTSRRCRRWSRDRTRSLFRAIADRSPST